MTVYQYKAADSEGKTVRGTLDAEGEQAVVAKLHEMGCIPISIATASKQQAALNFDLSRMFKNLVERVSNKDLLVFTEDMASLLSAGLPVDKSLSILIDVTSKEKFRNIIRDVLKRVEGGSYLSEALFHHPNVFSEFYVNMIRAGEAGGVQDVILARLSGFLKTSQEMRDYIKSALIYPTFLVLASGLSIIILITYVIPKFSLIFADMGDAIPVYTRILLGFSGVLKGYWWLMIGGIAGIAFAIRQYSRTTSGRIRIDRLLLKIPLIGETTIKIEVSRFARTLGTLITSGVPILQAIHLVSDILGNRVIAESMGRIHDRVKEGERLSSPLNESGYFPSLAVQMITVGEETGRLAEMLIRVADNYERLVRNLIQRLIGLLEPTLILIMGLVVGFIVIAMLVPIFSMNDLPF
jgi:type II secretion system protein F